MAGRWTSNAGPRASSKTGPVRRPASRIAAVRRAEPAYNSRKYLGAAGLRVIRTETGTDCEAQDMVGSRLPARGGASGAAAPRDTSPDTASAALSSRTGRERVAPAGSSPRSAAREPWSVQLRPPG
eukprot:11193920-Lingulodinium_polyedra.AAC.1